MNPIIRTPNKYQIPSQKINTKKCVLTTKS